MKSLLSFLIFFLCISNAIAQQKNFIDHPYIEVKGSADTLVSPDRIYLNILISEEDTNGRTSLEKLEQRMISELEKLSIDIEKQLLIADAGSNFKSYFLSGQKILKNKSYSLLVYQASTLGKVLRVLQEIEISNINLGKTEHSQINLIQSQMKAKAVANAKEAAGAMSKAIGQDIGKAIYISETNSYTYALQGKATGEQIRGASSINETYSPNLSFDQMEVKSEVLVRFSLN